MQIRNLETFLTIVQLQSYSRAAETLYVTQSALSQQIARMEAELGFALFDHSRKNVIQLTNAGKHFYDEIQLLLNDYQRIIRESSLIASSEQNHVRIGIEHEDTRMLPKEALEIFIKENPLARIDIHYEMHRNLLQLLIDGEYTAVFLPRPLYIPEDYVYSEIIQQKIICVTTEEQPVPNGQKLSFRHLKNYRLFIPNPDSYFDLLAVTAQIHQIEPSIRFATYEDLYFQRGAKQKTAYITNEAKKDIFSRMNTYETDIDFRTSFGFITHKNANALTKSFIAINQKLVIINEDCKK